MEVIDTAIEEIAVARDGCPEEHPESNLTSLRIHTENLTAAESSIRDADIAVELAAFTRNQIIPSRRQPSWPRLMRCPRM